MKLTIINDTHLLVKRTAGTTPESSQALLEWTFQQFSNLCTLANGGDLLINGDLFDSAQPKAVALDRLGSANKIDGRTLAFLTLHLWLLNNPKHTLYLAAGNHDLPRNDGLPSAFGSLCDQLSFLHNNVVVINGENFTCPHFSVVPHYANQEMFDAALQAVLGASAPYVFVHANFDNHFAEQSDHSLNISAEVAEQFKKAGKTLVFAHEHNGKHLGHVRIIGNQIPTSISDCLDSNPCKRYAVLDYSTQELKLQDFIQLAGIYTEVDWKDGTLPKGKKFIRVAGTAEYEQAAEVAAKLAAWRQESDAFVITNAVRVGEFTSGLIQEDVQSESFDIWKEIMQHIPDHLKEFAQEVKHHD